jgi:hypothetical protein
VVEHGPAGEISAATMGSAAVVAGWHLYEARRIMASMGVPEAIVGARLLLDWLIEQPTDEIRPRTISQMGPNKVRDKAKRDAAVAVLVDANWLRQGKNADGVLVLQLNPKARAAL